MTDAKRWIKVGLLVWGLNMIFCGSTYAQVKNVYAEQRDYHRGEVLWVGPVQTINQKFKIPYADVENCYAKSGQMGIALSNNLPSYGPNDSGFRLPVDYLQAGYNHHLSWTVIGELTAINPLETVHWKLDRWGLPTAAGANHTIGFEPASGQTIQGLAAGKKRTFTDLFKNKKEPIELTLHGYVQVAVFCNADVCKLPDASTSVDVSQTSVGLSLPFLPTVGKPEEGTQLVLDDYYQLVFKGVEACYYTMTPTVHDVGELRRNAADPWLTKDKTYASTLTVKCGEGNGDRKAYLLLGAPQYANSEEYAARTLVATNLKGIGIAYNSGEAFTGCNSIEPYDTKIPVGAWTSSTGNNGKTEFTGTKTIYFGICRYGPISDVEKGDLHGSVQYVHWIE